MRQFEVSREGRLIQGHVLDVSRPALEAALRRYDPLLYIKWEPKKFRGRGVWELRRKPEEKKALYAGNFQGMDLYCLEYKETSIVNHVLDIGYLNYDILNRLKKMDMWAITDRGKDISKVVEYNEAKYLDKVEDEAFKEREYNIKQHKSLIRDFMEFTNSGGNPYRIADHWGK